MAVTAVVDTAGAASDAAAALFGILLNATPAAADELMMPLSILASLVSGMSALHSRP